MTHEHARFCLRTRSLNVCAEIIKNEHKTTRHKTKQRTHMLKRFGHADDGAFDPLNETLPENRASSRVCAYCVYTADVRSVLDTIKRTLKNAMWRSVLGGDLPVGIGQTNLNPRETFRPAGINATRLQPHTCVLCVARRAMKCATHSRNTLHAQAPRNVRTQPQQQQQRTPLEDIKVTRIVTNIL